VQELIRAEIVVAGGWISFARYMELALYAPGMGYYSGGAAKFGGAGDFVTAPEMSPLFGKALARQATQVLELVSNEDNGGGDILEFGAGSGKLALELLLELEKLGRLPGRYWILEVSAELRQRQRELFEQRAPHLASRVDWLEQLPEKFNGLMLANEVLDAMPVHIVSWHDAGIFERGVAWDGKNFMWSERPLLGGVLFEAARELNLFADPGTHYISEISLAVRGFMRSLAGVLQQGAIVLIDYGFGRSEYYHPQRNQGTLMCHIRHHAHDDSFYLPGLQDITSHVDFSAVADIVTDSNLELLGYTTQAHFLINCGITDILAQTPAENAGDYLPLANQLQKLVSPAEMGELFKVIAFGKLGKNSHPTLVGFGAGDKSRLL
jgi:SAM-dependent MidA family methyltransferase